jgi:DNA-directed RNA polymerase subunit RPC12/RpoP
MITSRFNKDEADVQRDYMASKLRKRRTAAFVGMLLAMVILFIVLAMAVTPYKMEPFFMPLFPAILSLLLFGVAFSAAGMYFRMKLWRLADPSARRPMLVKSARMSLVFLVIFIMVLVIVLPMSPLAPKPNYAEGILNKTDHAQVGPSTHIRLEFQGAGTFAAVRSGVSITCTNNLSLDYYLLTKTDVDRLDADLDQIADMAKASRTNVSGFEYGKLDLDSGLYTVVIVNANNETANISYTVHRTTSGELTILLVLFSLVYIAMAAAWIQYTKKLARSSDLPVALLPALVQAPPQVERPTVQRAPLGGATASGLASTPQPSYPVAASEPTAGGTRMAITCPRCSTTFDVVRGGGPTRIKCPSCGKEGTLAGLPMPAREPQPEAPPAAPQPVAQEPYIPRVERLAPEAPAYPAAYERPAPSAAPALIVQPQAPAPAEIPEVPALPAEPVMPVTPAPKRNIACPRCRQIFAIDKVDGPQQIRCPHCGKEGAIGTKRQPATAAAPPVPAPAPRPAAPVAPKMISCPACRKAFSVAETRRPLQVKCPNCGKEGVLRK